MILISPPNQKYHPNNFPDVKLLILLTTIPSPKINKDVDKTPPINNIELESLSHIILLTILFLNPSREVYYFKTPPNHLQILITRIKIPCQTMIPVTIMNIIRATISFLRIFKRK